MLLGLEAINSSKNPEDDDADRTENFIKGTKYCERAFKLNNRNAAASNALFELFMQRGEKRRALKLAERTIQFAETLTLYSSGQIHAGYLAQTEGSMGEAMRHFNAALKSSPKNPLAAIGLAQSQVKAGEWFLHIDSRRMTVMFFIGEVPAAIHTLDSLMQPPNPQRPVEAIVMLASLRARPQPGLSSADAAVDRQKARELLETILRTLDLFQPTKPNGTASKSKSETYARRKAVALFGEDTDLLFEAARLWQDGDRTRMRLILEEAARIVQDRVEAGQPGEPRLLNNLAVLRHNDGDFTAARSLYERALTGASLVEGAAGEGMATTILYNLGRVYEDQGEASTAREAYDKLLGRHPEYADGNNLTYLV